MGVSLFIVGGVMGSYGTYLPDGLNGNLSVRIQGKPHHRAMTQSYSHND